MSIEWGEIHFSNSSRISSGMLSTSCNCLGFSILLAVIQNKCNNRIQFLSVMNLLGNRRRISLLLSICFFDCPNLFHIFCMLISYVADGHNVIDIALVFQTDKEAGVIFLLHFIGTSICSCFSLLSEEDLVISSPGSRDNSFLLNLYFPIACLLLSNRNNKENGFAPTLVCEYTSM